MKKTVGSQPGLPTVVLVGSVHKHSGQTLQKMKKKL